MSYTRTTWIARVGTALNRFLKTNESTGSVELTNDPTGVTTAGTPFTVDNMNKIEQGIYDAHEAMGNNFTELDSGGSPIFTQVTTTKGPNPPVDNSDATMPQVGIGGFTYAQSSYLVENGGAQIWIPSTGVFIVHIEFDATAIAGITPSTPVLHFITRQAGGYNVTVTQDAPAGSQLRAWAMRVL